MSLLKLKLLAKVVLIASLFLSRISPAMAVTFSPTSIPLSDPEIVNPERGYHRWMNQEMVPQPQTAYDEYKRYEWRTLEPSLNNYDFSSIDYDKNRAEANGRRFAFRVRAMKSATSGSIYVPDYLNQYGWMNGSTFIPDWNSSYFLTRLEKLMTELGKRYDGQLAWLDIGIYGQYGEWTLSISYPSGYSEITQDSYQRIINAHYNAFPNTRLIANGNHSKAARYALEKSPKIGVRSDALGENGFAWTLRDKHLRTDKDGDPVTWDLIKERWKTAPIVAEYHSCMKTYPLTPECNFTNARNQVKEFHVNTISNGNIYDFAKLSSDEQNEARLVGKESGYRFSLSSLTLPDILTLGNSFEVTSSWLNSGVTPAYSPWIVKLRLSHTSLASKFEPTLGIDLQNLLPSTTNTFTLPSSLPTGTYNVSLIISDSSAKYVQPLKLANTGRQSDGSYLLGQITVATSPSPSPSSSPTASPSPSSNTLILTPTDDAYTDTAYPTTNYGSRLILWTKLNSTTTYLKFDLNNSVLSGKAIRSAILRLRVSDAAYANSTDTVNPLNLHSVTSNSWSESTVTEATKPALGTIIASFTGANPAGYWLQTDITPHLIGKEGQLVSLGLANMSTDGIGIDSKESTQSSELVITYGDKVLGDVNGDGVVTLADYDQVVLDIATSQNNSDTNNDGNTDIFDLNEVIKILTQ